MNHVYASILMIIFLPPFYGQTLIQRFVNWMSVLDMNKPEKTTKRTENWLIPPALCFILH